jgi:hypothetical protein
MNFEDEYFLRPALRGDWGLLIRYIETDGQLTGEMRKFLAGVLRGEIKRPNNRAPTVATAQRHLGMAFFVLCRRREGLNLAAAIDRTAEQFGADRRTVQRAIKRWRGKDLEAAAEAIFSELPELREILVDKQHVEQPA